MLVKDTETYTNRVKCTADGFLCSSSWPGWLWVWGKRCCRWNFVNVTFWCLNPPKILLYSHLSYRSGGSKLRDRYLKIWASKTKTICTTAFHQIWNRFYCRLGEWPFSVFLYWVIFLFVNVLALNSPSFWWRIPSFLPFLLLCVGLMCESSRPTRSRSVHPQRNTFLSSIEIPHDWNCPRWKHIIAIHGSWTAPIGRFGPCQASGLAESLQGGRGLCLHGPVSLEAP